MITLGTQVSEETILAAQAAVPIEIGDGEGWLLDGCRKKHYTPVEIFYEGDKIGFMAYSFDDRGSLVVHVLHSCARFPAATLFEAAAEKIAHAYRCPSVICQTTKATVAARYLQFGYKVTGVAFERLRKVS